MTAQPKPETLESHLGAGLAVVKPGPLAAFSETDEYGDWADVDDGLIGMEHVGFQMPRLISDMRPGGGWQDETTGEKIDHLNVVWLASAPGRAWWADAYGKGNKSPDCRSADMVAPDPQSPEPQSERCASCPRAQWVDGRQECGVRLNALVYDVDGNHLARLSFGRTAIKHVRGYLSALKALVPARKPMSQVTEITLEEVEKDGMRWLEPVLRPGERISRADAQPLIALQQEFMASWRSVIAEDLARPEAGDAGDPFPKGTADEEPVLDSAGEPF